MKKLTITLEITVENSERGQALIDFLIEEVSSGALAEEFKNDDYVIDAVATTQVE